MSLFLSMFGYDYGVVPLLSCSTVVTEWPCLLLHCENYLSSVGDQDGQLLAASYQLSRLFVFSPLSHSVINLGFRLVLKFPHGTLGNPDDKVWPRVYGRGLAPCCSRVAMQHLDSLLLQGLSWPHGSVLSRTGVRGERELLPSSGFSGKYISGCTPAHAETSWRFPGTNIPGRAGEKEICLGTRDNKKQ